MGIQSCSDRLTSGTHGATEKLGKRLASEYFRQEKAKLKAEQDARRRAEERARAAEGTCGYEECLRAAAERGLEQFLVCLQIDSRIIQEILNTDAETSRKRCRLLLHPDKNRTRSDAMNLAYTLAAAQDWV